MCILETTEKVDGNTEKYGKSEKKFKKCLHLLDVDCDWCDRKSYCTNKAAELNGQLHISQLNVVTADLSMFSTCQVVCCRGDCLLCFWLGLGVRVRSTSNLSTFYGLLPVPPPSDKRSAVQLLRPLHGNTPNPLFFFVFLLTLEELLHSAMETGLQTRGQTTDRHQSQNMQLLDSRTQQVVRQTAVD